MKNEYFTIKFQEAYKQKWRSKHKTEQQFAESICLRGNKTSITFRYVSAWLNGVVPEADNIKLICEVLDLPENFFSPTAREDIYRFDEAHQKGVSESLLAKFDSIGLSFSFFESIIDLINFNEHFPLYAPLRFERANDPSSFFGYVANGKYVRMENAEIESEGNNEDLQIVKGDKVYSLSEADLRYLKEVQDNFEIFLKVHFQSRSEEMKREEDEVNTIAQERRRSGNCKTYATATGTGLLTEDELQNKDRFRKYVTGVNDNGNSSEER